MPGLKAWQAAAVAAAFNSAQALPTTQETEVVPEHTILMLLGAQKAATTSVFNLLNDAKLVCGASHRYNPDGSEKESHFFDMQDPDFPYPPKNATADFEGQYESGCKFFMDATPNYLYEGLAPLRMSMFMPVHWSDSVKLIAILREPIARDLSFFNMMKHEWVTAGGGDTDSVRLGKISKVMCEGPIDGKFPTYGFASGCKVHDWETRCAGGRGNINDAYHFCAQYSGASIDQIQTLTGYTAYDALAQGASPYNRLAHGMYYPQVKAYTTAFSRKRLMLLEFDAFLAEQPKYIKSIVDFYGLSYSAVSHIKALPEDNSEDFDGKIKIITCKVREQLTSIFGPYTTKLFEYMRSSQADGTAPVEEPPVAGVSMWKAPECSSKAELESDGGGGSRSVEASARTSSAVQRSRAHKREGGDGSKSAAEHHEKGGHGGHGDGAKFGDSAESSSKHGRGEMVPPK